MTTQEFLEEELNYEMFIVHRRPSEWCTATEVLDIQTILSWNKNYNCVYDSFYTTAYNPPITEPATVPTRTTHRTTIACVHSSGVFLDR